MQNRHVELDRRECRRWWAFQRDEWRRCCALQLSGLSSDHRKAMRAWAAARWSTTAHRVRAAQVVRSGAWLGVAAVETFTRPTVAGWWWWRNPNKSGEWHMTEVHACGQGLYCPSLNMADTPNVVAYRGWFGEWAGPLTPPATPNSKLNEQSGQ